MATATKIIGNKGELVIPKSLRKEAGIKPRQKVEIIPTRNGLLIVPLRKKLSDFAGLFGNKGVKNIKELDAAIHELLAGI